MTESNIGLLYKIASSIPQCEKIDGRTFLRSYYMMRCKELTRGYGLPEKHFSNKARCPYCCLEWRRNTQVKVIPIKLSKRQKKRIKSLRANNFNRYHVESKKKLLHSNKMEQICSLCNHKTNTPLLKPTKEKIITTYKDNVNTVKKETSNVQENVKLLKKVDNNQFKSEKAINVYSNAFDVFSMKNEKNILKSTVKETPKLIKNSKKKKDKFAGLCHKSVLASAKLKEEKEKKNKLNLFLKPSETS